jgi:hypothetical protein
MRGDRKETSTCGIIEETIQGDYHAEVYDYSRGW